MFDDNHPHPEELNNEETAFDIGWLEVCLDVKDLKKSIEFYRKLGFWLSFGALEEGWVVMESDQVVIALYQGHIRKNLLNFRGGDIQNIADTLRERGIALKSDVEMEPDGSLGCTVEDPDGNIIFFNTHPDELEELEGEDFYGV